MTDLPEDRGPMPHAAEEEEARLRSVALQTAKSIMVARQQAERELLESKESLEQANTELRARLAWLEAVLASMAAAVVATDAEGAMTFLNPAAEALTGWPRTEALGLPAEKVLPIVHERTRHVMSSPVPAALRAQHTAGAARHGLLIARDGRETPIEHRAAPISAEDGRLLGVVVVMHDTGDRLRAERRKEEFLAILAHELRSPLAPIRQAASVLKAEGATADQVRWSHDVIARQIEQMARLLDDLLDVSRIGRGELELRRQWTDVKDVVEVALQTARPRLEQRRHELVLDLPEQRLELDADPARLAQVLANLLTNAAKYTDAGGRVGLSAAREGREVVLRVSDTGIGMSREVLPHVFELFSQSQAAVQRSQEGLGIGLALVKGLVELHAGVVEADSEGPGRGSVFTVRLPAGRRAAAAAGAVGDEAATSAQAAAPVRRKVLIADDNRDSAESIAMIFRIYGHDVYVVYDGEAAVTTFEESRPDFVVLDIGMPKLNGYDAARRIRAAPGGRSVTLVALTGWGQESDKERALAAGFNHHFTKPIDPDVLNELLSE